MKPLARSHSLRDSAAVTVRWMLGRVSTSSFLPAQLANDLRALPERLIHNVMQQVLLAHDIEQKCLPRRRSQGVLCLCNRRRQRRRKTHVDLDDRRGSVRGDRERLDTVEHSADRVHARSTAECS